MINDQTTHPFFTLLEGTWTGEGRRETAGLKPVAQCMEALRADQRVGVSLLSRTEAGL
jgi:hypothetical protein